MFLSDWLFDPRAIVAVALLVPVYFGFITQKSMKVLLLAVASNLFWIAGAQLDLELTGLVTAIMTIVVGLSFAVYVPVALVRRRTTDMGPEPIGQQGRMLMAKTRYRDITTPLLDVVMVFCGQTMLIVLYMKEICRTSEDPHWFNPALWACGWVVQFMAYTAFQFDFNEETNFWKRIMTLSVGKLRTEKLYQISLVEVDVREMAFRSVLSCLSNIVYRVFLWMSMPIYISRGHGGVELVMQAVSIIYVMTLSDLSLPVQIEGAERIDADVFKRAQHVDTSHDREENAPLTSFDAY